MCQRLHFKPSQQDEVKSKRDFHLIKVMTTSESQQKNGAEVSNVHEMNQWIIIEEDFYH